MVYGQIASKRDRKRESAREITCACNLLDRGSAIECCSKTPKATELKKLFVAKFKTVEHGRISSTYRFIRPRRGKMPSRSLASSDLENNLKMCLIGNGIFIPLPIVQVILDQISQTKLLPF